MGIDKIKKVLTIRGYLGKVLILLGKQKRTELDFQSLALPPELPRQTTNFNFKKTVKANTACSMRLKLFKQSAKKSLVELIRRSFSVGGSYLGKPNIYYCRTTSKQKKIIA